MRAACDDARRSAHDARTVTLYEIANARSGDKGNRLNMLWSAATRAHHRGRRASDGGTRRGCVRRPQASRVVRYDLPKLAAFNFVLDDVLEGGVNVEPGLDGHGKSLSFLLLEISVQIATARGCDASHE